MGKEQDELGVAKGRVLTLKLCPGKHAEGRTEKMNRRRMPICAAQHRHRRSKREKKRQLPANQDAGGRG